MLVHDDPNLAPDRGLLQTPGAFLWWYAELMDEAGNGMILIWSFGLPFLPGLQSSARQGQAWRPGEHPSLNVVVYKAGRPVFYVLQNLKPERVWWDGEHAWRFGHTSMVVRDDERGRFLDIDLDVRPTNAEPISGRVRVHGAVPRTLGGDMLSGECRDHAWTPLALPAFGTADVSFGQNERAQIFGRAYFDRNWSVRPLDQLGFDTWIWGHQSCRDEERVYYAFWTLESETPTCVGLTYTPDGRVCVEEGIAFSGSASGSTMYGMPRFEELVVTRDGEPWVRQKLSKPVDNGPFYLRYLTATCDTTQALSERPPGDLAPLDGVRSGSAEIIVPSRIDLALHRPMVRMRVDEEGEDNPLMLSFFEGSRQGRVGRLARRIGRELLPWARAAS